MINMSENRSRGLHLYGKTRFIAYKLIQLNLLLNLQVNNKQSNNKIKVTKSNENSMIIRKQKIWQPWSANRFHKPV